MHCLHLFVASYFYGALKPACDQDSDDPVEAKSPPSIWSVIISYYCWKSLGARRIYAQHILFGLCS